MRRLPHNIIYILLCIGALCSTARLSTSAEVGVASDSSSDAKDSPIESIAFLGDSNLWLGGDDCSRPDAWSHWIAKALGAERARSFARSGATITNTSATVADTTLYTELLHDSNTLLLQALRLKGAVERGEFPSPDIIFIYGGSNDAWFADRRPGLFDTDSVRINAATASMPSRNIDDGRTAAIPVTLRSSLRLITEILRQTAPDSKMIVVGPPFMTKAPAEMVTKVTDAMEAEAKALELPIIRLDTTALIDPAVETRTLTMTRDGAHTTPEGARRIARHILSHLTPKLFIITHNP